MNVKHSQNMRNGVSKPGMGAITRAVMTLSGDGDSSVLDVMEAWAYLIRTGIYKMLQGNYKAYADDIMGMGLIDDKGTINHDKIKQFEEANEQKARTEDDVATECGAADGSANDSRSD